MTTTTVTAVGWHPGVDAYMIAAEDENGEFLGATMLQEPEVVALAFAEMLDAQVEVGAPIADRR
jgi:hypothetical protein